MARRKHPAWALLTLLAALWWSLQAVQAEISPLLRTHIGEIVGDRTNTLSLSYLYSTRGGPSVWGHYRIEFVKDRMVLFLSPEELRILKGLCEQARGRSSRHLPGPVGSFQPSGGYVHYYQQRAVRKLTVSVCEDFAIQLEGTETCFYEDAPPALRRGAIKFSPQQWPNLDRNMIRAASVVQLMAAQEKFKRTLVGTGDQTLTFRIQQPDAVIVAGSGFECLLGPKDWASFKRSFFEAKTKAKRRETGTTGVFNAGGGTLQVQAVNGKIEMGWNRHHPLGHLEDIDPFARPTPGMGSTPLRLPPERWPAATRLLQETDALLFPDEP